MLKRILLAVVPALLVSAIALAAAGPTSIPSIWNPGGFHGIAPGLVGSDGTNIAPGFVPYDSFGNPVDRKPTYRFSVTGITPIAAPTDILRICGSSTKTVRVKRVMMGGIATTAGQLPAALIRRTAAGTPGSATVTSIAAEQHDVSDAAPTVTVGYVQTANYTTLGTSGGQAGVARAYLNTAAGGATSPAVFDFSNRQDKPQVLRGTADCLVVNANGATLPAGATLDFEVETEEDNT